MSFDTVLFTKQAERITALTETNAKLKTSLENTNRECRALQRDADFYRGIVKAIEDSEMLQEQWISFISYLKLYNPDIPGITMAEKIFR